MTKSSWQFVIGDQNWVEYGGVWAQKTGRGEYKFLEWHPGESGRKGRAGVTTIDLNAMRREIPSSLKTVGLRLVRGRLMNHAGDQVPVKHQSITIAEALYSTWGGSWSGEEFLGRGSPSKVFGKTLYGQLNRAHRRAFGLGRQ